jgi:hypothetical protein
MQALSLDLLAIGILLFMLRVREDTVTKEILRQFVTKYFSSSLERRRRLLSRLQLGKSHPGLQSELHTINFINA